VLFPVSYLLTSLSLDNKNLSASQTWSTWLNWRLRYNYFRFGKQTFVILEFYFRFRFRPYCRNPHNILHKVVKFDLYRTTESVIDFSRWSHKYNSTSGFLFVNATAFKRSKSISKPNFVDVSQFTAEITILPFWKNKRPQYWNSTSGFDFDYIVAIYVLFASGCPKSSKSDCLLRKYDVMSILKMAAAVAQYYFRFCFCWCHCLQKVTIYQQTKFRRHISICGWAITISVSEKTNVRHIACSFCTRPLNSIQIGPLTAEIWRHNRFLMMAAAAAQYYFRIRICWYHCFQKVQVYQQTKFRRHVSIYVVVVVIA